MSSIAFIFLLCLGSMHACNARLLSASNDNQTGRKAYHVIEEIEKAKKLSDGTSNPSTMTAANSIASVESQAQELGAQNYNGIISHENHGSGITKLSFYSVLQQSTQTKGKNGKARSMLGSIPRHTEEAVDTKESEAVDDIEMMDYAQPHRKPPIHNERP